jgi:reversibly glycosylated polypeptide/UDP-arabinopyranose mutase
MEDIAVVVPTIRPECFKQFLIDWKDLFSKYSIELIKVWDKDIPRLKHDRKEFLAEDIMGCYSDLIFGKNDGVRNLGLAYIAQFLPEIETVIALDDDVSPCGDTIRDHLDALKMRVPISWLSTASEYMRGFPYGIREEAEVVLSHGVWEGIKDYDAPSQLVRGNPQATFYQGPIPKGIYYPMCGMNIAFKRKMLPYMYFAPMGYKVGLDRFADIWLGITSKRIIDKEGWAVVSGYATVRHKKASNVFTNLQKEAKGISLNEGFWQGIEDDPYFKLYREKRNRWQKFIEEQK